LDAKSSIRVNANPIKHFSYIKPLKIPMKLRSTKI